MPACWPPALSLQPWLEHSPLRLEPHPHRAQALAPAHANRECARFATMVGLILLHRIFGRVVPFAAGRAGKITLLDQRRLNLPRSLRINGALPADHMMPRSARVTLMPCMVS